MDPATIIGLVVIVILGLLVFGAALGLLLMSNYRLRQEVHSLREQVAALTRLLTAEREDPWQTYARGQISGRGQRGRSSRRASGSRPSSFSDSLPSGPLPWPLS